MNEKEFGDKVAHLLQASLTNIDDATCAKLKGARRAALERYQEEAYATNLAWAGPLGERFANLFAQRSLLWAPLIALALALGIGGYVHWQNEVDDVDAFLLSGDLPIRAYIDQDFDAWLKGYSR